MGNKQNPDTKDPKEWEEEREVQGSCWGPPGKQEVHSGASRAKIKKHGSRG